MGNAGLKYFKKEGDLWQIDAALRGMVQYKEFNLLDDPKPLGRFDVVFCRNVLIYFDQLTKAWSWLASPVSLQATGPCSWVAPRRCWASPTNSSP